MTIPRANRREALATAIAQHHAEHYCAPTEQELADRLGISKSYVHMLLADLRGAGRVQGAGRQLRMVAATERMV